MTTDNDEGKPRGKSRLVFAGGALLAVVAAGVLAVPAIREQFRPSEAGGEAASGPAHYTSLHPPLVINLRDARGESRFMQITMEVMARDARMIDAVRSHAPAIRSSLILLYANTRYEEAITREGKQQMLDEGLANVREVLRETTGRDDVEAVYFSNLVIQ